MVGAVALAAAASVSWAWCRALPSLGQRLGFFDVPDDAGLKVHRQPAVPLAGPGILTGLLVALAIVGEMRIALVAGLVLITVLGVVDDRLQLSPILRLVAETVVAVLLGTRWLDDGVGMFAFGVVVIVVTINAVNLYDGLDMLAGSSAAVGLAALGALAALQGSSPWLSLGTVAALLGFLPHNRPPAKVFLGDGGAYLTGAVMAVAIVDLGVAYGWAGTVAALGLLGMFGADLVATVFRRARSGTALFEGDREHVYDRMVDGGVAVRTVVARLVVAQAAMVVVVAVALAYLEPGLALVVALAVGGAGLAVTWRGAMRSA